MVAPRSRHRPHPQRHRFERRASTRLGRQSLRLLATTGLLLMATLVVGVTTGQGALLTLIAVAAVLAGLAGAVLGVVAIVLHRERAPAVYGGIAVFAIILLVLLHPLFIGD